MDSDVNPSESACEGTNTVSAELGGVVSRGWGGAERGEGRGRTRVCADPGEGDGVGVGELAAVGTDEVVAAVGEAVLVHLEQPLGLVDVPKPRTHASASSLDAAACLMEFSPLGSELVLGRLVCDSLSEEPARLALHRPQPA